MQRIDARRRRIIALEVLVAASFAILAYWVGSFYPSTQPIALLIGVALVFQTVYLELILGAVTQDRQPAAVKKIGQLLVQIDDPWSQAFADEMVGRIAKILEDLNKPTKGFHSEDELYNALRDEAEQLKAGEELFAVCANKSWDSLAVKGYLDENIAAASVRGAYIHRVFYEFDKNARDEAQRQANCGIRASLLIKQKIEALRGVNKIPSDLGIAIFNKEAVFIHRGVGRNTHAFRCDSHHLAEMIRSLFQIVEDMAVRVPCTSGSVTDAGVAEKAPEHSDSPSGK